MNFLTKIRRIYLIVGAIIGFLGIILIFTGKFDKLMQFLITSPFIKVLLISLLLNLISASIILELIAVGISGQRWPDKKHFRFYIPVWILLNMIQITGLVLFRSHFPGESS